MPIEEEREKTHANEARDVTDQSSRNKIHTHTSTTSKNYGIYIYLSSTSDFVLTFYI